MKNAPDSEESDEPEQLSKTIRSPELIIVDTQVYSIDRLYEYFQTDRGKRQIKELVGDKYCVAISNLRLSCKLVTTRNDYVYTLHDLLKFGTKVGDCRICKTKAHVTYRKMLDIPIRVNWSRHHSQTKFMLKQGFYHSQRTSNKKWSLTYQHKHFYNGPNCRKLLNRILNKIVRDAEKGRLISRDDMIEIVGFPDLKERYDKIVSFVRYGFLGNIEDVLSLQFRYVFSFEMVLRTLVFDKQLYFFKSANNYMMITKEMNKLRVRVICNEMIIERLIENDALSLLYNTVIPQYNTFNGQVVLFAEEYAFFDGAYIPMEMFKATIN